MTSPPASPRARVRPRVEVRPATPIAYSLGAEASELIRRAGQPLDPWQDDAEELLCSVRPDGKWACYEYGELVGRQNGKGGILEARVLGGLFLFGEKLLMWSAHEYKTALEAFLRVRGLIARLAEEGLISPDTVKVNNTNGEEGFELPGTGQRLKFIARSKSSGRGFSGDVNIIDETFAFTPSQQAALMPTMNARPNPQIIYTSTPPLDGESGEPMFALRERARAGGDDSLGWRDWSGTDVDLDHLDEIDLDDRALWRANNPALGIRITEETLARNRRSMTAVDFAREIVGIWPRQVGTGTGVIDAEVWNALADPESQMSGPMVMAIECNVERTAAAICAAGRRPDGIPHGETVDYRPGRGTGWLVDRVAELHRVHRPAAWVLDPGGPAGSLLVDLGDAGIEPHLVTAREMAQACGAFYDAVTAPAGDGFRHLGQPSLTIALRSARRRTVGDGAWAWARRDSTDISPLVAVTLALHGLAVHGSGDPLNNIW